MHAAKVFLSDTAYSYDTEYTYKYPDILVGVLKSGMRVLVPFGQGNTKRIGVVLRTYEREADQSIKSIIKLMDTEPLINPELMDLVVWLKEHTFCTYYEAFRTVLPSGYSLVKSVGYELANSALDSELTLPETELYEALKQANTKKEFDALIDSEENSKLIESLVEKGVLERSDIFKRRVGDETVRMVRLADGVSELPRETFTAKQKPVVDFLAENESASIKEICYILSVTQTIISNMLKKGLLIEYKFEAFRTPEFSANTEEFPTLSQEQQNAFLGIKKLVDAGKPAGALLHGVTGSGKTSVFINLIKSVVESGKSAMLLVPEISLTPQMVSKFKGLFGDAVAVIHSSLSLGQRLDEFKRIKAGIAKIVIGTRSAVFAPLSNIGIIIMDEEGESSYKSDMAPRYHARDVAIKRCGTHNCALLMASATPSLETYYYAQNGRFSLFELNNRYGNTKLPQVVVADMLTEAENGNYSNFCEDMVRRIKSEVNKGKQAILLLNRRGYNTIAFCHSCNETKKCPKCALPLTYHKANGKLMCHYCGYYEIYSEKCANCGADIKLSGLGTQLITEELENAFPEAKILRIDADTMNSRIAYEEKFADFRCGKYDIMVGTQMVAKGLDFPNVTTVGVISLDSSLFAGDYRSYERTYSLLTQVCGRGGRGKGEAVAYIQTLVPDHHIIKLATEQDYKKFYDQEISLRKELIYPPYCDICSVYFSSPLEPEAMKAAKAFVEHMKSHLQAFGKTIPLRVLGPARCGYGRINNRYKYALTIKCKQNSDFRKFMSELLLSFSKNRKYQNTRVYADINGD